MADKPVDSSPDSIDVEEAGEENSKSNEDECWGEEHLVGGRDEGHPVGGWGEGHPVGVGDVHGTLLLLVACHKNDYFD